MKKTFVTLFGGLLLAATAATAGAQVYVRIGPPPPPRREVIPAARPGYAWQYVWTPGEYVAAPRPAARWVPGHWRNSPRGYYWVEGHWR